MQVIERKINTKQYNVLNSNKSSTDKKKYLLKEIILDTDESLYGSFVTYKIGNDLYVAYESEKEEESLLDRVLKLDRKDKK